ncbi:hypothetical protein [Gayadomonas joobiniege]|uniref:hypothetical protein n=1 Tax=Gayadomonas joobiniege TaxID=1234606 RepID=UPI00036571CE|nr:hypothetical protein [Gayadomonas joobiniege]
MNRWQKLMQQGNVHYSDNNFAKAALFYHRAIRQLEIQKENKPESIEAVQGWICGFHNLAQVFQRTGDIEKARDCLIIPHQTMLAVSRNKKASNQQQVNAIQALKLTLIPLLEFAQKYPTCEHCLESLLEQYQNQFRRVLH